MNRLPLTLLLIVTLTSSSFGLEKFDFEQGCEEYKIYRFEERTRYFTNNGDCDLYYWETPSFTDLDYRWGFKLKGCILSGIAIEGNAEAIPWPKVKLNRVYAQSVSPQTRDLLVRVWQLTMQQKDRKKPLLYSDGTTYFLGRFNHDIDGNIDSQQHGTFWSPPIFSFDEELTELANTIFFYIFIEDNSVSEEDIQRKCYAILHRTEEERNEAIQEYNRLNNLLSDYFSPPDAYGTSAAAPFASRSNPPKELCIEYVEGYRALLKHYYYYRGGAFFESKHFDSLYIPNWRELNLPESYGNTRGWDDPFATSETDTQSPADHPDTE